MAFVKRAVVPIEKVLEPAEIKAEMEKIAKDRTPEDKTETKESK